VNSSFVAIGLLWTLILTIIYGLINFVLQAVGLPDLKRDWLGTPETAFPAVIFRRPLEMDWIFMLSSTWPACSRSERFIFEARGTGRSIALANAAALTIPLLKPFTAINVVLASLGAFSVFDLIYVMTQGGPFKSPTWHD